MIDPADPMSSDGVPGASRRSVDFAREVALVVIVFGLMARWAQLTLRLSEDGYRTAVVSLEILRVLLLSMPGLVALVPLLLVAGLRHQHLLRPWSEVEKAHYVRTLILGVVLWATWAAVTFDFNLFYDQAYDVDRLILAALTALAFWRPVFVLPHVFLFIALEHQFDHPFGRQIFARLILEDLLLLFAASLLVGALLKRRVTRTLLFVACALLASYYWYPGYTKLVRGWVGYGQLYLGGFASHANGWLATWPVDRVENLLRLGAILDWPARLVTLVSELAAVLFFVHRKVPRVLLSAWALLHAGIWVFSGVSFFVWIAVDVAFLALFLARLERWPELFTRASAVGGAALVLASPLWVRPPMVGWYDTRLVYTYRYEAIDQDGRSAAFPADATPLGEAWCARDFPFLMDGKTLLIRYGKTNDRQLADRVAALGNDPESVFALEDRYGQVYFDEAQAVALDRFLRTTASNWNRRGSALHRLSRASPPRTCLSPRAPPEPVIVAGRNVHSIRVHQVTFLWDGQHFREIRRVPVRTIEVPG